MEEKKFTCKTCKYATDFGSNYKKHLRSAKHVRMQQLFKEEMESKEEKEPVEYICKYCGKPFKHMQSMYYHIKYTCKQNNGEEDLKELVRLMNLQIDQQRCQLEKKDEQLERQSKHIEKLMEKLKVPNNITNNIIQNNNIQLLSYKDTDTSHLTDKDYIQSIKQVTFCVKDMIEKIHFNPTKPENMNIYISNMKDKYLMVYEDGNWNLKNKMNEINSLYESKEMMIEEWLESGQHKYPELQSKFLQYLNNKENDETMNMVKEEIKLMMYNNKKKVMEV